MIYESLTALLASKPLPPIILLFGEEDFMLDEAYSKLIEKALVSDVSGFNFDTVDADNTTADAVITMANAFPLMAERRVVSVKNFEKYFSGRASKKNEIKSPFTKYFQAPQPSTLLILRSSASELNGISSAVSNSKQTEKGQKKLATLKFPYDVLIEKAACLEFPKVYERDVPSWIARRLREKGREISPEAAEFLTAKVGNSLRELNNEIEKILIFLQNKKKITDEDISAVVGDSRIYNVFELQKAIGGRDLPRSLDIMFHMLAAEKQEILIISMITRYFVVLWKLSEASQQTRNHFELSKTVGISSFFIPEYLGALQKYSSKQLNNAFYALRDADLKLKSTNLPADIILQQCLLSIISP
ncbi:MAG: DNA polymerase III subunit delta [Bacteroidetes bacterium]|nr:DNA polymerase III subunit delta [Bacteroidota bacterium]